MRGSFCQALPIGCMRVFMHAFLQLGGDVGEPLQRHLELGVLVAAHDLEQLVAGEHQLRDHGHQVFERVDVDADRLVGDLAIRRSSSSSPPACGCGRGAARRSAWRRLRLPARRRRASAGGFAERALELVERDLARAQRALQRLRHQRADGRGLRGFGSSRRGGRRRHALELADQIAGRRPRARPAWLLELVEHLLDAGRWSTGSA